MHARAPLDGHIEKGIERGSMGVHGLCVCMHLHAWVCICVLIRACAAG